MDLWNPAAFFISFFMSLIMPAMFAIPMGMSVELCLIMWPLRWIAGYFVANLFIQPLGFKLAKDIFDFDPLK